MLFEYLSASKKGYTICTLLGLTLTFMHISMMLILMQTLIICQRGVKIYERLSMQHEALSVCFYLKPGHRCMLRSLFVFTI